MKNQANTLQRAAGGRGTDSRVPGAQDHGTISSLLEPSSTSVIDQIVPIQLTTIANLALGIVSMSLSKGQSIGLNGTNNAYLAWVYLTQSLISVLQGATLDITSAPVWFWNLASALRPKVVGYKTGSINYKWSIEGGQGTGTYVPPQQFPLGNGAYYVLGTPSQSTINEFPILDLSVVYTPEQGKDALNTLFQQFPDAGMYKRTGDPGDTMFSRDASAFQAVYPEWGSSLDGNAGVASSIFSEVPLLTPLLAKFAPYQSVLFRGFQECRRSGGSPQYVIPKMANISDPRLLRSKIPPIFKFYNLDLFYLRLSYTMCLAMERAARDNASAPPVPCPLNPWEVQLMLRQTLLAQMGNTMASDLTLSGSQDIFLVPFVTGNNGAAITNGAIPNPKFPLVFAENIRSCQRIEAEVGEKYKVHVDFVPILARPTPTVVPQLGNFQWQDASGTYSDLYANTVYFDVNLIDLSYQGVGSMQFITPNAKQLSFIIEEWNRWITGLGNNLLPLVSVGSEGGAAVLKTVVNTMHTRYVAPANSTQKGGITTPLAKQVSKTKILKLGGGLQRDTISAPRPTPGSTSEYYRNVVIDSLTGVQPFFSPAMKFLKGFVHPVTFVAFANVQDGALSFFQTMQMEPNKVLYSATEQILTTENEQTITADNTFLTAANLDIKTSLSAVSEVETDLRELTKRGEEVSLRLWQA